jgi:hypothetical protein
MEGLIELFSLNVLIYQSFIEHHATVHRAWKWMITAHLLSVWLVVHALLETKSAWKFQISDSPTAMNHNVMDTLDMDRVWEASVGRGLSPIR